ncbi:MAG TPA: pyridoxamine 5'-phosphate oxidase [Thermoanaerobaculia bacterium]|nr:pyridoxamine 5'-phosphate oxidase [Thermoanaerobaculia bacterium]
MPPLAETNLDPDPFLQFAGWFREAIEAEIPLAEAMTLATADSDGRPSARVVLLKGFDDDGFLFFTNYESRKSRELAENPRAALCFWWPVLQRQVRIEGDVLRLSSGESEAYFATRPRGSQLGAWASPQSEVIPGRQVLEETMVELIGRWADAPIPRPPHWGGYRLNARSIEFWQNRDDRLHDRFRYTRVDRAWRIDRLAP